MNELMNWVNEWMNELKSYLSHQFTFKISQKDSQEILITTRHHALIIDGHQSTNVGEDP